jgi:hypothetical protein
VVFGRSTFEIMLLDSDFPVSGNLRSWMDNTVWFVVNCAVKSFDTLYRLRTTKASSGEV